MTRRGAPVIGAPVIGAPVIGAIRDRLVVAGYVAAWSLVRRLPEGLAYAGARAAADAVWRRRGGGVTRLEANLRRVVARAGPPDTDLRALSRAGLRSYFRYWCDAFRLPGWSREELLARTVVDDEHILRDALASGRGVVAVLPHMGNWDHAGAWLALTDVRFTTVAERLRPEAVYDRFVAYRERLGMEVLPLTGSSASVFGALAQRLRAGGMVCLLADRDLTASGVEVQFFGEPARMPAGPAALAIHTGAALMPCTTWYDGPRLRIRMHALIEPPREGSAARAARVAATMQAVADVFADAIAAHPADWHMLQRLWLADLDGRAPAATVPAET